MNVDKIYSYMFNKIPQRVVEGEKSIHLVETIGRVISSPQNRLIMGVTALASQPFIDLHNKDVDKETAQVSCAKTMGKIIAGTTTGVAVRYLAIKAAENMSRTPQELASGVVKKLTKFNTFLSTPNLKPQNPEFYKQYRNAVGTYIGLAVMLVTNFAIDLPLTNYLTNFFTKKIQSKDATTPVKEQGGTA